MATLELLESRRLFAAGQIDTSFGGGDGSVDVRLNRRDRAPAATDIAIDDQGRTVIAAFYRKHQQVSFTRLTADGAVDATFGKDGIYAIDSGFNAKAKGPFQITVDHDGRILVMLKSRLTRLNVNGGFDHTFGAKGIVAQFPIFSRPEDVTVDSANRPLISGMSQGKTGLRGTVVRLNVAGALDTSFGLGGAYKTPVPKFENRRPGSAYGLAIEVLDTGKIVGAMHIFYNTSKDRDRDGISAFRLNADGSLDKTYGTDGSTTVTVQITDLRSGYTTFDGFYKDGGMLVGRRTGDRDNSLDWEKSWTYVNPDGQIERDDLLLIPSSDVADPGFEAFAWEVVGIQDDGKVLVSGSSDSSPQQIRFNSDFTLDSSFSASFLLFTSERVVLAGNRALQFTKVPDDPALSKLRVTAITL